VRVSHRARCAPAASVGADGTWPAYNPPMLRPIPAALLATALACAAPQHATRVPALTGKSVTIAAPDLAGREMTVAPGGDRVRVVDFWATWCEPCREQLAHLDALGRRFEGAGVSVYAVSFDEDRALLDKFLEEHPVSFPVLWDRGGTRLSEPLDLQRLPTTLVIDRKGIVRHVRVGWDAAQADALEREVAKLVAESP
jgi:cytochrome c biogenesis protein CcmG, thiol:disulfide interchange protein DsbE